MCEHWWWHWKWPASIFTYRNFTCFKIVVHISFAVKVVFPKDLQHMLWVTGSTVLYLSWLSKGMCACITGSHPTDRNLRLLVRERLDSSLPFYQWVYGIGRNLHYYIKTYSLSVLGLVSAAAFNWLTIDQGGNCPGNQGKLKRLEMVR